MFKRNAIITSLALTLQLLFTVGSAWAKAPTSTTVVEVLEVGSIQIDNPTKFPYALKLDDRAMATLLPGARVLLKNTPTGEHILTARSIGKMNIPSQTLRARVKANRRTKLRLEQVMGSLTVTNPNPMPLVLRVDGTIRTMIQPGATERFSQLKPGRHTIQLQGDKGIKSSGSAIVRAGQVTAFTPPMILGSMRIRNQTGGRIHVLIDGKRSGSIARGASRRFMSLPIGAHRVEIRGARGLHITRTFLARGDGKGTMTVAVNAAKRPRRFVKKARQAELVSVEFTL
jgi:hypothetical protein